MYLFRKMSFSISLGTYMYMLLVFICADSLKSLYWVPVISEIYCCIIFKEVTSNNIAKQFEDSCTRDQSRLWMKSHFKSDKFHWSSYKLFTPLTMALNFIYKYLFIITFLVFTNLMQIRFFVLFLYLYFYFYSMHYNCIDLIPIEIWHNSYFWDVDPWCILQATLLLIVLLF